MTPKIYVKYLIIIVVIFTGYHLIIWYLFTSQIFKPKYGTSVGDMGRMSYQVSMLHNRELKYTLPQEHFHKNNFKNQKVDIITIGDSFSNGRALGENPYYQDFLATELNASVLNIAPYEKYNSLETIIGLYNSGYLEKTKPKAIIIESVERAVPDRYSKEIDFDIRDVKAIPEEKSLKVTYMPADMINNANFKLPYYMIKYNFNNNAQKYVYKLELTKALFTINNGQEILIFRDDISHISKFTPEKVHKVNENFNKLARLLGTLNIKLFFMPAPDKYDLYYDFLKYNKYPKNPFFDIIRPLDKEYYFVDTKQILLPLLEKGVKDVYWVDDTHWSQKASYAISKDKIFKQY